MNISIVIPSYNGKILLEKNLPYVIDAVRAGDELIIVDDASTDATVDFLRARYKLVESSSLEIEHVRRNIGTQSSHLRGEIDGKALHLMINRVNQRFAYSCNQGVKVAVHDIIVLLNNDVVPEPTFLQALVPHFEDPKVFAVGCKEKASAEGDREYGRSEAWFERGFFVHRRSADQNGTDTAWVAGGSGAFRKKYWERLGGFDLDYKPAYGEDIDLCFRAKIMGLKILFEPQSIVHHNHESTNASVFGHKQIQIMSFKNAFLFMWKTAPVRERIIHLLWLPYHFVFTTIRSEGTFVVGFLQAIATILRIV